ncbi:SIR2 family protein [Streptococcus oralis]|uniref:SIR2 family protein n=1 Tax=Streptococcus oralis TaxID=1303 RepID=UPI0022836D04|nr:SIR2 family protein [Streptococcus oralis]MCY7076474.1 SIR2 family protein [Streptococcus oralis]
MSSNVEHGKIYHYVSNDNILRDLTEEQQIKSLSTFINKQFLSKNLVIFVGSGCSSGAIPLMSKTMSDIIENNKDVYEKVKEFINAKDLAYLIRNLKLCNKWLEENKKDNENEIKIINDVLEKAEQSNDNIGEFVSTLSKEQLYSIDKHIYKTFSDIESLLNWLQSGLSFQPSNDDLKSVINTLKGEFLKTIPALDDDKYKDNETINTYNKFYQSVFKYRTELSNKINIVTTNYDLFNEYSLESNRIVYSTGFENTLYRNFNVNSFKQRVVDDTNRYKDVWQPTSKEANLLKIHGSINWTSDESGQLIQKDLFKQSDEEIIIYPTMLKHRQTAQAPYSELFREFANVLQIPNTVLIVMGYGFPDEHINNIISQNLKHQDFTLIVLGNKSENNMKKFFDEFKTQDGFHLIGGDTSCDGVKAHYFNYIVDKIINYTPKIESEQEGEDLDE